MEGFLTFIFFTILAFYLLGIIGRWALRVWLGKKQRQFEQQFTGAQSNGWYGRPTEEPKRKEGEVRVDRSGTTHKRVNSGVGDYVEFEEVEESIDIKE
jgi:hypothetical protein